MGGKALEAKGVTTRRVTADEYHNHLVPDILRRLTALVPGVEASVIPSYRNKPDFGDVDILINSDTLPVDGADRIVQGFEPRACVRNGPVLSFDHDGFQVDLIFYGLPVHDFAARYFAYNDLGNLIGRIARYAGFIFGHAGLFYPVRDPANADRMIDTVLVTRHFDQALAFLGYDPAVHAEGFDDLEAIYRYAVSSKFYTPEPFALENRGHRARVRDKKRPTYRAFLEWAADNAPYPKPGAALLLTEHLLRAKHAFPAFSADYHAALKRNRLERDFRALYNGRVVAAITGLEGRALGRAMARIAASAGGKEALRDRVLRLSHANDPGATQVQVADLVRELLEQRPTASS